ncbi:MAG: glycosyltransferase family 1 protein [Candidatus Shapirobacteria bacterium]|nr:glycosyltransferase family 1 protein [Candidatus Shapirobacteria bacterium]MDD5481720.1 glycosyltransferase family 1 protein [Candidatus Shapirobacteria bacterium]
MIIGIDGRSLEKIEITGIGEYTKNLLRGLSFAGIKCNLYCTKTPPKSNIPRNINVKILKAKNKYHFEQVCLLRELSQNPPSLYHATGNSGIPLFYKGVSVLTVHDLIPITKKGYFKNSDFPVFSKTTFTINVKNAIQKAKKIVSISKTTKKNIIKTTHVRENKIKVIYPGVSVPKKIDSTIIKRFGLEKNGFILNNGGIDKRKNLERLIRSLPLVREVYPNIKLVITGNNVSYEKILMGLAKKMGINKNIIFTGFVSREALWALIKKSSFICYPSEDEGFGLPIIEAIEAKKPIILSNIPVFIEIAGDFGLFINKASPQEMAKKIIELKRDKNLQKDLVKKSLSKKGFFSWEKAVQKTIMLYKHIIK